MSVRAGFAYHDLKPPPATLFADVVAGLSARPKTLPPKYFYDEAGAALFEAICELPEYYPTRTELGMLQTLGHEIAERIGPGSEIVEYGSGSGVKTAILLEALQPAAYTAIDISGEQLRRAMTSLSRAFPAVRVSAVAADYSGPLELPLGLGAGGRRVVFFPGSTIGNFTRAEAVSFLKHARALAGAGAGGAMLVGVDTRKEVKLLDAAYNDAQGVTAAFNLNLLARINRELGADFDLAAFRHRAFYDEAQGRVEMHLVSLVAQRVSIGEHTFAFEAGESIHTENSYKYAPDEFQALARDGGFRPGHVWLDPQALFSIHYLTV